MVADEIGFSSFPAMDVDTDFSAKAWTARTAQATNLTSVSSELARYKINISVDTVVVTERHKQTQNRLCKE